MELIELTTKEELDGLGSALTIEGLARDSVKDLIDWVKNYTPMKVERAYAIEGNIMNSVYGLTGSNAYPSEDCTLVAIKLEDMEDPMRVALPRFNIGGRWFDDIVANNARREA